MNGSPTGAAQNVLRQDVERTGAQRRRVLRIFSHRIDSGPALQHLEAIGRHQNGFRRLIEPVVRTSNPLQEPRATFGGTDIDHQVDITPVHPKIQRRRAHHSTQLAGRHRIFNATPLRHIERTVMQGDGEIVVIRTPEFLKKKFRLTARIDEHQRGLVRLDMRVDFAERVARRVAGPGQMLFGVEHRHDRLRSGLRRHQIGMRLATRRLRHQKTAQLFRLGDRRGESDRGEAWRQHKEARKAERQQVTALRCDKRMQFVEDDTLERAEHVRRIGACEQERKLLGRREQNIRRIATLALAFGCGRVAGARFYTHR